MNNNSFLSSKSLYLVSLVMLFVSMINVADAFAIEQEELVNKINNQMYSQQENGLQTLKGEIHFNTKEKDQRIEAGYLKLIWKAGHSPKLKIEGTDKLTGNAKKKAERTLNLIKNDYKNFDFPPFIQTKLSTDHVEKVTKKNGKYHVRVQKEGRDKELIRVYDEKFNLIKLKSSTQGPEVDVSNRTISRKNVVTELSKRATKWNLSGEYFGLKNGNFVFIGTTLKQFAKLRGGSAWVVLELKNIQLNKEIPDDVYSGDKGSKSQVFRKLHSVSIDGRTGK
ncbi:MAG: hypothetical protein ABEJ65_11460, partial [bacterium]